MIASVRGLAVLAAFALALLVVALVAKQPEHVAIDRTLMPGFDAAKITELVFERPGQPAIQIVRSGTGWRWKDPAAVADGATVDAALAALRGVRWHRRAASAVAGPARASVRVIGGTQPTTIAIGAPVAGAEQTWLVIDDKAFLVDSWVAAALAPEPVALRVRELLTSAPAATAINVTSTLSGTFRIEGTRRVKPDTVWVDPTLVRAAVDAMTAVEIVALGPTRPDASKSFAVVLEGPGASDRSELTLAGTCASTTADLVFVHSTPGDGCIERAKLDAMTAACAALAAPATQVVDQRPLPIEPKSITLVDEAVIDVDARPQVSTPKAGTQPADPDRVKELVAAMTAPAELSHRPKTPPTGSLSAVDGTGVEVIFDVYDESVLVRRGELIALRPSHAAWRTIMRPSNAYRDATLWREDEMTITEIAVDDVKYTRGAVLGEWTRTPAGPVDAPLVDALASSLAAVRAPATRGHAATKHRLTVTFTPPAGKPSTHELQLGPPAHDGCLANVDGSRVRLALPICTAAWALLKQ